MPIGRSRPGDRSAGTFTGFGGAPAGQTAAAFAPGGYYNQQPLGSAAKPLDPGAEAPYYPTNPSPAIPIGGPFQNLPNMGPFNPPAIANLIAALGGSTAPTNPYGNIGPSIEPPGFGHLPQPTMPTPEEWQAIVAKIGNQMASGAPFVNPNNGLGGVGGGPFTRSLTGRNGYSGPSPFRAEPHGSGFAPDPRRLFQALGNNNAMSGFAGGTNVSPQQLLALRQQNLQNNPPATARGGYRPTY